MDDTQAEPTPAIAIEQPEPNPPSAPPKATLRTLDERLAAVEVACGIRYADEG